MARSERIVVDNNALISRLLLPDSTPGRAVRKAVDEAQLLVSEATLIELADVLARRKFDRYVSVADRQRFLMLLGSVAEMVGITYPIRACRDPKDDKFLELAVNGAASAIVTGDRDLLVLNPFHAVAILSPAAYLRR
jgi:putative PIN family toxin of toxin-antitoxin system